MHFKAMVDTDLCNPAPHGSCSNDTDDHLVSRSLPYNLNDSKTQSSKLIVADGYDFPNSMRVLSITPLGEHGIPA